MEEEKEIKDPATADEELIAEKTEGPEAVDGSDNRDDDGESGPAKGRGHNFIVSRKWILLSLLGLILVMAGIGVTFFAPDLRSHKKDVKQETKINLPFMGIKEDNLSEEVLPPFFIPPSTMPKRGAIRIDLSVIWDGLSSIRYRKKELEIRNDIFKYIIKVAGETDELNSRIPSMEEEIARLLQESLDTGDLAIKIREIKYL